MRWNRGLLQRWQILDEATGRPVTLRQSAHQLALTEEYLVILDSAFTIEMRQLLGDALDLPAPPTALASLRMRAEAPDNVLWLVRRGNLAPGRPTVPARKVVIPGEANHLAARWDNPGGRLTLVVLHTPTQDLSEWIRPGEPMLDGSSADPALVGLPIAMPLVGGALGVHHLAPDGTVESHRHEHPIFTMGLGLCTFAGAGGAGSPTTSVWVDAVGFSAAQVPERLATVYRDRLDTGGIDALRRRPVVPASVARLDIDDGRIDGWAAPSGWSLLSPTFVPHPRAPSPAGWLVVVALADRTHAFPPASSGDEIWIFDAAAVARGPLCRLGHPTLDLAFTLHTAWVPSIAPSPRDYFVTVKSDYEVRRLRPSWGWLPPDFPCRDAIEETLKKAFDFDKLETLLEKTVLPRFPTR